MIHITQDDAHIFCTHEQVQDEVIGCLELAQTIYDIFGLDLRIELSTRPENRIGDDALWDDAEAALEGRIAAVGVEYALNEGDGAFYGPKIDLHMTDSIGRSWQMGTIQLDYQMPERFEITYAGDDNAEHRPAMVHRALFGSFERFIGILIEHFAGAFPLWIAPLQVSVLPVADRHNEYAQSVVDEARRRGHPRRGGHPLGVRRPQDRGGRGAARPLHPGGRRSRGRGRQRVGAPQGRGRPGAPGRSPICVRRCCSRSRRARSSGLTSATPPRGRSRIGHGRRGTRPGRARSGCRPRPG